MKGLLCLVLLAFLASACAQAPAQETPNLPVPVTPEPDATRTPAPAVDAPPAVPGQQALPAPGISLEENLRINPPMPRDLTASLSPDGILLAWQPPVPVSVRHTYSDTPLYYRVYRREGARRTERIGTSETLSYLDRTARPGVQYAYMVSAVHERGLEGTRTDAIQAPVR